MYGLDIAGREKGDYVIIILELPQEGEEQWAE
jgi:hypothetical protein